MSNQSEVARKEPNGGTSADPGGRAANAESTLRPAVDIFETDEGITLQADMPGVSKERLNVRVEGTNLLVEGEIAITRQEEMQALYADVRSATYRRNFLLSGELESSRIEANLKDGVLTVRIPKRAELRPRRIEVRAE